MLRCLIAAAIFLSAAICVADETAGPKLYLDTNRGPVACVACHAGAFACRTTASEFIYETQKMNPYATTSKGAKWNPVVHRVEKAKHP